MRKRPESVTILAWVLILMGFAGLAGDAYQFKSIQPGHNETIWIACVHVLGVVAGAFMLRGRDWARWLAVAWVAFHVAISLQHVGPAIVHAIFLAVFVYFLFRPDARAYFRSTPSPI